MGFLGEKFRFVDRNIDVPLSLGFIAFGIIAGQYLGIVGGGLGLMRILIRNYTDRKSHSSPQHAPQGASRHAMHPVAVHA